MARLAAIILLSTFALLGTSCRSNRSGPPSSDEAVRQQVRHASSQIALHISAEDIVEAEQWIHSLFLLHDDVAQRFEVGPFTSRGPAAFRGFFERVRDHYGDLNLFVTIKRIDVSNDVATAYVTIHFTGLRLDPAPPREISFVAQDIWTFEFDRGHFRLRTWGSDPHSQGGGGSI